MKVEVGTPTPILGSEDFDYIARSIPYRNPTEEQKTINMRLSYYLRALLLWLKNGSVVRIESEIDRLHV